MKPFARENSRQIQIRLWLYFFFVSLFLDLGGELGIRFIALAILSVSLLLHPSALAFAFKNPLIIAVFTIWPIIAVIVGFISGADSSLVIQNVIALMSFPFLVGFFSIFKLQDSLWAVEKAAITVATVACLFWVAILTNSSFSQAMAEKLTAMGVGYFGRRELGGVNFAVVYFKSTLFFVYVSVLLISKRKYLTLSLLVVALLAAMSKTGIALVVITLLIRKLVHRPILILILICLGIIAVLIGVNLNVIFNIVSALSKDTNTATIRLEHWDSLVSFFTQNPLSFLFGQGAGTTFYSTAVDAYVNNIELDYLNSIRKFGVIWFSIFCIFILNIGNLLLQKKNKPWMSISLTITFFACGTNPVLLTLLFFSILAFSYVEVKRI